MNNCERCTNKRIRNICKICHEGDCFEEKAITNADRIRKMNDVELAKFIGAIKCNTLFIECGYPACGSMEGKYCMGVKRDTDGDILAWLQSLNNC